LKAKQDEKTEAEKMEAEKMEAKTREEEAVRHQEIVFSYLWL